MDSIAPKQDKVVPVSGNLCILGHEIPVNEETLERAGREGSEVLDDLFGCSIAYSTALLSCVPAFYTSQIDFPTVIEHVLGSLYKHPSYWLKLKQTLAVDEGHVTIHICPISGVPMIIGSDKLFTININGTMEIKIQGTALSRLSKITHMNLDPGAAQEGLEYLREAGLVASMIEDMDDFVSNLFAFVGGSSEDAFVDFMQELLHSGEAYLDLDLEAGTCAIDTSLAADLDDEETLDDILKDGEVDYFNDLPDTNIDESEGLIPDFMLPPEDDADTLDTFQDSPGEDQKNPNSVFLKGNDTVH